MTSVLARLGQLEARTAIQQICRPNKRKREEWTCRRCLARTGQSRGYGDDATGRLSVGDYLFPREQRKDGYGEATAGPTWCRTETIKSRTDERTAWRAAGNGRRPPNARASTNTRDWPNEQRDNDSGGTRATSQEDLWERFEQADAEGGVSPETAVQVAPSPAAKDVRPLLDHPDRDASLLDIDYAAVLPQALSSRQPDLTARCLFAATRADDLDFIRSLTTETFSSILEVLEPASSMDKLASTHLEISGAVQKHFGIASMQQIAHEHSRIVDEVVAIRRSGSVKLTSQDYTTLLRTARDLGMRGLSRKVWKYLHQDGYTPNIECYNYLMAGYIFNKANSSAGRHKSRALPFHVLGRSAQRLGSAYASYRVGEHGLKSEVTTVFREMLGQGVTANEESFRLVIMAAAREGDLGTVKSVLRKVWEIDVDKITSTADEAGFLPKKLGTDSILYPTDALLFTIAHAFGTNNDIPAALRLVDFVARHYNLTISTRTWAQLFEWTFVLSVPRTGLKARTDGTRTGQLPQQSVMSLWETMTGPPYNIQPTMGMYNHLFKNLMYRDMSAAIITHMREGQQLLRHSRTLKHEARGRLVAGVEAAEQDPDNNTGLGVSVEKLRSEWEIASLISRRDNFWFKRWLRLLLGSLRTTSTSPSIYVQDIVLTSIPQSLSKWRHYAPDTVRYELPGGRIEFKIREQAYVDRTAISRVKRRMETERVLDRAKRYVGDGWLRSSRRLVPKRFRGREAEHGLVLEDAQVQSPDSEASGDDPVQASGKVEVEEDTDSLRAEVKEAVDRALDER